MKNFKEYNLNITGTITIGADVGQELDFYLQNNIDNMVFFEPRLGPFLDLQEKVSRYPGKNIQCFNIALGEKDETRNMYVAGGGQSSSFLKPKLHLQMHPEILFSNPPLLCNLKTLDSFNFSSIFNFIHIDVQGFELSVLKGARQTLHNIHAISSEINVIELYEDCVLLDDLDKFLSSFGFKRIESDVNAQGWGDALYIKNL